MAIYLDYAATSPVDVRVADKMSTCLTLDGKFGNPDSSSHKYGWDAEYEISISRKYVADLIGASSKEIIWTSGATESDNLAIKGCAFLNKDKGRHIVTSKTEHKAVLDTCSFLQSQGFDITYLDPCKDGSISLNSVKNAVRDDTILISLMYVNNETGIINDIENIGYFARKKSIIFHVDGAQAIGKIKVDVEKDNIDLLSLASHKIYGPKGVGALYIRRKPRIKLQAQIHGGGHERGFRSGTLPTHQIVGMGEAYRLANIELFNDQKHINILATKLLDGFKSLPKVYLNGSDANRVDNILNIYFAGVDGDSLMRSLKDIALSSGSACTSASVEPSHVLLSMGLTNKQASKSIRFSFGRMTTVEEIELTIKLVKESIIKLRNLSSSWDERLI